MIPKKASSLYKQTAEDLNVSDMLIESMVEFYYKTIRSCLTELVHPRINIEGLGQFVIKDKHVSKAIERYTKNLPNFDISTFKAHYNKKRLETKLDLLIAVEKKIIEQENKKELIKKIKDEKYTETNLAEPETDN